MIEARQWWAQLIGIARDTGQVWWAALPRLLMWVLVGDLVLATTLRALVPLAPINLWLVLALFSCGVVVYLACQILALRTVADVAGSWRYLESVDDRATSWTRLLGTTLLPFLGIWSSFGGMEERMVEFHSLIALAHGEFVASKFIGLLNINTHGRLWLLLGILVGAYVVRRALDIAHDTTGIRVLGMLAALVEGFFMLVGFFVIATAIGKVFVWLADTNLAMWWEDWCEGLQRVIHLNLGFLTDHVLPFWNETLWPNLTAAALEPLLWLGIALLVFGWAMTSGADLLDRAPLKQSGTRRLIVEVQEAFFGDVDDRWMPMWNAAKLTFRAGLPLLAAYVVAWALWAVASAWLRTGILTSLGGHDAGWWETVRPMTSTMLDLITEPVRLVLIGVVTHRAIVGFHQRGQEAS